MDGRGCRCSLCAERVWMCSVNAFGLDNWNVLDCHVHHLRQCDDADRPDGRCAGRREDARQGCAAESWQLPAQQHPTQNSDMKGRRLNESVVTDHPDMRSAAGTQTQTCRKRSVLRHGASETQYARVGTEHSRMPLSDRRGVSASTCSLVTFLSGQKKK
eukprot:3941284-Rhodomonas_salina.12